MSIYMYITVCERWVGDGDRLLHIDSSSSDHSSTSFSSWLELLNRGSLRAQSPLSTAGSQFGILSPTGSNFNWLKPSVSWLYFYLTTTYFHCSSAYLLRCISWLTARSRVNMLQQKSTNNSAILRFFARTPSMIRRIVRTGEVVNHFLRKTFWFFLRTFSISGSI